MNKFFVKPANDKIWNYHEFLTFLIANQHKPIVLEMNEGPCFESIGGFKLLEQFDYQQVVLITRNLLEQHPQFQIKVRQAWYFLKVDPSQDYTSYHTWSKTKIFGCFYNRPLWYRIGLAANLQHDYSHCSVINIRSDPHLDNRQLFEIQKLFENCVDSFQKFATVVTTWPQQLEITDTYGFYTTNEHTDQLACFYSDFLIDVVAETWTQGDCFFPTEKTVRPMLLKKPMIVMGPKNYLEYLRQMGFRTFSDFWDEEYDGYEGRDRYLKILKLIDNLATKSKNELESMYWDMQHILDWNYNLLLTQEYNKKIIKL
jgi:hypothetical protein